VLAFMPAATSPKVYVDRHPAAVDEPTTKPRRIDPPDRGLRSIFIK
jgi:hypothetical protein